MPRYHHDSSLTIAAATAAIDAAIFTAAAAATTLWLGRWTVDFVGPVETVNNTVTD